MIHAGSKNGAILRALLAAPLPSTDLAEAVDEITPTLARTMARLRSRGLVDRYLGPSPKGGTRAVYFLTQAGHKAVSEAA